MFNQLRLKMTLINVAVTMLLFAIFISSVYSLLHFNSKRSCDYFLTKISEKVLDNTLTDLPSRINRRNDNTFPGFIPPPPRPNFFFVKLDGDGNITKYSSGITIEPIDLPDLSAATLNKSSPRSEIEFNNTTFAYLYTKLPNNDGTLLIFNDLSDEQASMKTLMTNLLLVCLFCTLLSFIASFFMAKHAIKPIQYALNQQKNFVSDASHELRTPITIIQANLDIITGAPVHDTVENNRNWIDNIQGETTRMTELINSLLFLARADAKQQLLEKEYFSLNQTILHAVTPFALIAENQTVQLATDLCADLTALGDPARLKQVLTILIDNALLHTPAKGKIIITSQAQDNIFHLVITDTGEGIAAEHLPKLFDRFYQADSSRNKGGSGLGLSMAKWIIEQHDGTITIASTLRKGTTVTIKLPLPSK